MSNRFAYPTPLTNVRIANGRVCLDMRPKELGLPPITDTTTEAWKLLPTRFEELCERVYLTDVNTPNPKVMITHPALEDSGRRFEVSLRVQGIVQSVNIAPLGNWTG